MLHILLMLLIAVCGSLIGAKLKLPAGVLLGAIISTVTFQLIWGGASAPSFVKIISQGLVGTHIGTLLSREDFTRLKNLWLPAIELLLTLLTFNLSTAWLLSLTTEMSIVTAICAFAPCSIADMALLCQELGGNTGVVASVQSLRLIAILSLTPLLAARVIPRKGSERASVRMGKSFVLNRYAFVTLGIGLSASVLGYALHVPAGCLSFPILVVGGWQLLWGKGSFSASLRKPAQCLSGMLVGSYIALEQLKLLTQSLLPVLLVLLGFVGLNYLLAKAFSSQGMEFATALFSTAPGGMSDMGLLATEFGGDLVTVAFFQQIRYVGVVVLYPPMIHLLAALSK